MGGVSSAGRPSRSRSSDQRAALHQGTRSNSAASAATGAQPAAGGPTSTGARAESGPSGSDEPRIDETDRRRRQELEDAAMARRLMLEEFGLNGVPSARGGLSVAMANALGSGSRLGLRHAACPACQAQNEFRSTSTNTITLRCGMCAHEFQVAGSSSSSQPNAANVSTPYAMQICRRCGTMNQFPAPPPGRPLPDVRCGQCGYVAPASQRALRRLRGGERELANTGGPLVRINVNGERRVVSLLALLSLMAEENDRSNPAQGSDIAALPTRKLAAAHGTDMQLGEQTKCLICLDHFADGDDVKTLPCLHFYHQRCVDQWLRMDNSCPVCKTPIGQTMQG